MESSLKQNIQQVDTGCLCVAQQLIDVMMRGVDNLDILPDEEGNKKNEQDASNKAQCMS